MKDYIKSEIKHIPFVLILFILFYGIVTFATTTLFNSSEVYYNNTTSGIQADKVQGAIDELYACASNYAAYNQRLTSAENTIGNGSLTTTSQNLIGAVNGLNDQIVSLEKVSVNTTGWNANIGTGYCRWVKYGKLVIADITCMETTLAISPSNIFAFAPNGFKPKATSYAQFGSWDVSGNKKLTNAFANVEVSINTNGEVKQGITGSMPVGSAFHFQFIYEVA